MSSSVAPIAVIQGAEAPEIQRCLAEFITRHQGQARIVGLLEVFGDDEAACKHSYLRATASCEEFQIFQDLGKAADACSLLPAGLIAASQAIVRQIGEGCDLVVLSKFGKLEAENGSGLVPAFIAALEAGVPILTSVSPRFMREWSEFATPLYSRFACSGTEIATWWQQMAEARV